jgi:hypothetical protein
MKKDTDLRRYEHQSVVEFRVVFELLRRINKYAPQVRRDLLDRISGVQDGPDLESAAAAWASRWHLCNREGPAAWAMAIGLDTAKQVPEFGWNLNTYAQFRTDSRLPDGYIDETGVDIFLPTLSLKWNPSRESQAKLRERISSTVLDEVNPQIEAATAQYRDFLAPFRHQDPDRAITFLLRYQILEEKYSDLANDSQKYREQPDRVQSYPLPDVKRDVDEAARQAGLEPRASRQGRPRHHRA